MDEMNEAIYSPEWTKIGAEVLKEYQDDKFKNIHDLGINVAFLTSKEAPVTKGKAKHDLKEGGGICVLSANIPDDGYYKEKIKQLEKEKADLERELRQVRADLFNAAEVCSERADRIRKLEAALIEAAIK